jgi:3-dehydroquinate synthetase
MDKKVIDGQLRLVLARGLGDAFVADQFDSSALGQTFAAHAALCDD